MTKQRQRHVVMIPALTSQDKTALVPSNPRVKSIAFRFRWGVDTVIKRVSNALPSPIEQQIYLRVAAGYRIHPESLRKMLNVFRGTDELKSTDLREVSVGQNMVVSRFDEIVEKVEQALALVDKTSDCADYMMSMDSAAKLVEVYGDHAEEMFGEIVENLYDVARLLGIKSESPHIIVGVAVKVLVKKISGHRDGNPFPLTIEEIFGHQNKRGFDE